MASSTPTFQYSVEKKVILAPYTSFQIGGPADFFAEVESPQDCAALISEAKNKKIPFFVLGGGSNTLFHENGFRGLVIRPVFKKITVDGNRITAQAGALLSQLVNTAVEEGFAGIEGWVGLPGTVGGAIRGNAGASGVEIKDVLVHADIFDILKNATRTYKTPELDLSYRHSLLKENKNYIILSATFEFEKRASPDALRAHMTEILKKRNTTQPKGKSAGCIFKNPAPGISAGKLIDESGCKNSRAGDIEISSTHGNFFLNHGKGTQKQVIELIHETQKTVKEKTGYDLHTEIEIVPEYIF